MGIPVGNIVYGIRMEGVGKDSLVFSLGGDAAQWRFTTGEVGSTIDPNGLCKPWLIEGSLPVISYSSDFKTGRFMIGDATFNLLCVINDPDLDPRFYFLQTDHQFFAQLGADLSSSGTTVTLVGSNVSGLDYTAIYVSREVIVLGAEGATGVYSGCERHCHYSPAVTVDIDNPAHTKDVYDTFRLRQRRLVTFFALDLEAATGWDDEVIIWQGVLEDSGRPEWTNIEIRCLGLTSQIKDVKILPHPWRAVLTEAFMVGPERYYARFEAVDEYGRDTRQVPLAMDSSPAYNDYTYVFFEGGIHKLYSYGDDGNRFYYMLPYDPAYQSRAIKFDDLEPGQIAKECFPVDPAAPGKTGGPTDTLLPMGGSTGSVLKAVQQALTSTEYSVNGAADLGEDFGFSIPAEMLDSDSFAEAEVRLGDRVLMPRTFFGASEEPEEGLSKTIDQVFQALGAVWTQTSNGKLGVEVIRDIEDPGEDIVTIGDGDILEVTSYHTGDNRLVAKVNVTYARKGDGKGRKLNTRHQVEQGDLVSPRGKLDLDLGGYADASTALRVATDYLDRWSQAVPIIGIKTHLSVDIPVGGLCKLTAPDVLNEVGGQIQGEGVTGVRCHVVSKTYNLSGKNPHMEYQLLFTGRRLQNIGWIAPAGTVASYSGGGPYDITLNANDYVPASGGRYTVDAAAFTAGDVCYLLDQYGTFRAQLPALSLVTPGSNLLRMGSAPSVTPVANDIVIFAPWDKQDPQQQGSFVSIADTNGELGVSNDPGFQYMG